MTNLFQYHPADAWPFVGYHEPVVSDDTAAPFGGEPEYYLSFTHWYESEKFRGVSERYRRYLLSVEDPVMVAMEASGFSSTHKRADWDAVRKQVIMCGLFFQLTHNADLYDELLSSNGINTGYPDVDQALEHLRATFAGERKGVHVLVHGTLEECNPLSVNARLDAIFSKTRPDSLLLTGSTGVPAWAERWAMRHYVPVERFQVTDVDGDNPEEAFRHHLLAASSHIVLLTPEGVPTPADVAALRVAAEKAGRQVRHLALPA